jgi:hypothetical protein
MKFKPIEKTKHMARSVGPFDKLTALSQIEGLYARSFSATRAYTT